MHNLLFCPHTICMNYVTNTFLLVSSSVRSKQLLCFVHGQGQKREQKHTTKKFVGLHSHPPLLTMPELTGKKLRKHQSFLHFWQNSSLMSPCQISLLSSFFQTLPTPNHGMFCTCSSLLTDIFQASYQQSWPRSHP